MLRCIFLGGLVVSVAVATLACTTDPAPAGGPGGDAPDASTPDDPRSGGGSDTDPGSLPGTSLVHVDSKVEMLDEPCLDGTNVFYVRTKRSNSTALNKANIEKVPIDGGTPTVLVTDFVEPRYLAVDATHVYFGRGYCSSGAECGVFRVAKSGGDVQTLVTRAPDSKPLAISGGLAVDDTYVYFAASEYDTVFRLKKDGSGSLEALTDGSDFGVTGVQVDAEYVYWGIGNSEINLKLVRLAKSAPPGTAPETLAIVPDEGKAHANFRVTSTETEIIVGESRDSRQSDNRILRLPKTPGGTVTPVISDIFYLFSVRAYGGQAFFTDNGTVKKVPLAGGAATVIAKYPADSLKPLAVDATGLYWATADDLRRLKL